MGPRRSVLTRISLACVLATSLVPVPAFGQGQGLGFDFGFGYSAIGGDWGAVLDDGVAAEMNILWGMDRLRFLGGFNWVSYALTQAQGEVDSASQIEAHAGVSYFLLRGRRIQPYVEGRLIYERLRPENEVAGFPPPEEEGANNAPRYSGWGGSAVVGAFVTLSTSVWVDVAGHWAQFDTNEADLGYLGLGTVSSADRKGVRLGIVWYP